MKKLTTIIALLFSVACLSQKRCFLIGYSAIDNATSLPWTGGYDTCSVKYPNLYELKGLFEKKFHIHKVRILAITEYSIADRKDFYKSYTPKPRPIPDSIPPIPDSVMFISKRHIGEAYKRLQERLKTLEDKLVASKYNSLVEGIDAAYQALVDVATEDYRKRKVVK